MTSIIQQEALIVEVQILCGKIKNCILKKNQINELDGRMFKNITVINVKRRHVYDKFFGHWPNNYNNVYGSIYLHNI